MRMTTRLTALAAVPVLALAAGLAAASAASAAPTVNVSFSHSGGSDAPGSNAHWLPGHSGFDLSVAGNPATTYAVVNLHHFDPSLADTPEPAFTTDFYQAGTPRWAIGLNNGHYLFGYPTAQFGAKNWEYTGARPAGTPLYNDYATAVSLAETDGATTVTAAFIVLDGSAGTPQEAHVTNVTFDGRQLTR